MNQKLRAIIFSILDFLGSMSFAITLLISVSIVALIGTLIAQGQPADFYRDQFGPLWAELFDTLSVNDIFNSFGFFVLIWLLFISVAVCIWRRAPGILQEFSVFNRTQPDARAEYIQSTEWHSSNNVQATVADIQQHLTDNKYKYSVSEQSGDIHILARKGIMQRLGYLMVHFGVLVIILGALLDANIPLRFNLNSGDLQTTAGSSQVADATLLDVNSGSFRGRQELGINQTVDQAIVKTDSGYLRRQLPFSIQLREFNIDYYANGRPKTFASMLNIKRQGSDTSEQYIVSVEKGISLDGYRIYQRDYRDAGSGIQLTLWNLASNNAEGKDITFQIPYSLHQDQSGLPVELQFINFSKDNINPLQEHTLEEDFSSVGSALHTVTKNTNGMNIEIVNYLTPVTRNNKKFYLVGVRHEMDKKYSYGYIPVENNGELERLIKLNSLLNDKRKVRSIIRATAIETLKELEIDSRVIRNEWISEMEKMTQLFLEGGSKAVLIAYQPEKPTNRLDEINAATLARLQSLMKVFYTYILDEDKNISKGKENYNPRLMKGFNDIFSALDWMKTHNLQVLLKVSQFKHKQGSVLEISYYPGFYPVLSGMLLLLAGILMMFYIHHRRLELVISAGTNGSQITFTGSSRKSPVTLKNEFDRLLKLIK